MEVADRVVVMSSGRIEQVGTPSEVYENPANAFVFEFLGSVNKVSCEIRGGRPHHPDIALDALEAPPRKSAGLAYVRPHDLEIVPSASGPATVRFVATVGCNARLDVELENLPDLLEVELPTAQLTRLGLTVGSRIALSAARGQVY